MQYQDKNLELKSFSFFYEEYVADENWLIVQCNEEFLCGEKIQHFPKTPCYLMHRSAYQSFRNLSLKHRCCYVYQSFTEAEDRIYMWPAKITLNEIGPSRAYDKVMNDEEYLGLFLGENARKYYDVNPYALFLPDKVEFIDTIPLQSK